MVKNEIHNYECNALKNKDILYLRYTMRYYMFTLDSVFLQLASPNF